MVSFRAYLSVFILFFSVLSVGSGCNGDPTAVGMSACETGVAAVDLTNRSGLSAVLELVNFETGASVLTQEFQAGVDMMARREVPEGSYEVRVTGEGVKPSVTEIIVVCGGAIPVSVDLKTPPPVVEGLLSPGPALPLALQQQLLLQNRAFRGNPVPLRIPVDSCASLSRDPEFLSHLSPQNLWSISTIREQFNLNLVAVEEFLSATFPELVAEAGGRAIDVYYLGDGVTLEGETPVDAFEFRVRPQFRFLNDGLEEGGVFALQNVGPESFDGHDYPKMRLLSVYPRRHDFRSSIQIKQYQTEDAVGYGMNEFDNMVWTNAPQQVEAFEAGFTTRACEHDQFKDDFFLSFQLGLRVFGEAYAVFPVGWEPTHAGTIRCIQRKLGKAVHGRVDFIRRKLLDLNGTDRFELVPSEDGTSFAVSYVGDYDCPTESILGRP